MFRGLVGLLAILATAHAFVPLAPARLPSVRSTSKAGENSLGSGRLTVAPLFEGMIVYVSYVRT